MGFYASKAVAPLDFNFAPFVDVSGTSPEPTGDQIADYWSGYGELLSDNRATMENFDRREQATAKDDHPAREAIRREFNEWQRKNADVTLDRRRHLLAELLTQTPDYDTIAKLPGRVFDLFEQSIQEALAPKASTNGTNS